MIEFKNVSVSFDGKNLFSGLNLFISKGDKIVITGKSGLGKSTLLKLILGFAMPDNGFIYFNGLKIDRHSVWNVRKSTAFVTQNCDIGEGPVISQIKKYFDYKSNRHHSIEKLNQLLDYFLLSRDLLNKNIEELSGGERQRFGIITALLLNREVFLLDEITSALDSDLKKLTADYFLNNPNLTVIAISHDEIWQKNPNVKLIMPELLSGR